MRFHPTVLTAICCALPLLTGAVAGCGSPNDSCSGPYAALNCAGSDGGLDAADGSPGREGGADAPGDGPAHDGTAQGEGGDGGCTAPTSLDCNGSCVDPTQPAHCGSCENVCVGPDAGAGQATCTLEADGGGVCGLGCSGATSLDCAGACVDPSLAEHCGSCANACAGPTAGTGSAICTLGADGGGACSVTCTGATTQVCGDSCFAPTDPSHCGSCTNACTAPPSGNGQATCTGTTPACGVSCTTGFHVCSGDCLANSDEPSDIADPCILSEAFGVFVAPTGSDTIGTGTRAAPYATVGNAMDHAKTKGLTRVYACGTAGSYTENLVVSSSRTGVTVYGGLNCTTSASTWSYVASDKATVAPASGYALQVTAAVTFEDFAFTSAAATTPGSSSIAVFASNATGVVLDRCNVQAGAGMAGQDQMQPTGYGAAAPGGNPGTASAGGTSVPNPACPTSIGGAGGSPMAGGQPGADGQPGPPTNPSNGDTVLECQTVGIGGKVGATGSTGLPGSAAQSWASLTAAGWTSTPGQVGMLGTVGQGGGGGASSGPVSNGGGSGAAGGCGGVGGPPGTGGGSSIAVLMFNSTVGLQSSVLAAANAARGGNGALGQPGQTGGSGTTAAAECKGAAGGPGGNGGIGGGGAGGLSAGVVWTGTAPIITAGSQTFGALGAAGQNGDGTTTAKAGTAGAVVQFQ